MTSCYCSKLIPEVLDVEPADRTEAKYSEPDYPALECVEKSDPVEYHRNSRDSTFHFHLRFHEVCYVKQKSSDFLPEVGTEAGVEIADDEEMRSDVHVELLRLCVSFSSISKTSSNLISEVDEEREKERRKEGKEGNKRKRQIPFDVLET